MRLPRVAVMPATPLDSAQFGEFFPKHLGVSRNAEPAQNVLLERTIRQWLLFVKGKIGGYGLGKYNT
jgi:hypothetical protein